MLTIELTVSVPGSMPEEAKRMIIKYRKALFHENSLS